MNPKEEILKEMENYINGETLNEELSNSDLNEIRRLIRAEIAEIFFDLFKKRGVWV